MLVKYIYIITTQHYPESQIKYKSKATEIQRKMLEYISHNHRREIRIKRREMINDETELNCCCKHKSYEVRKYLNLLTTDDSN